ncbi:MAG: S-adenosylmethionine:tRNA ribosyltransferase-isomerase [candidate division TA06 bacterium ADurb.Bin417]|uniref:S-adenosylmethionine:tRNA ribosyltransferase-isomerase n=1 Tax=candidate division TA06 bacterium ADurb.Bin417 TaxID=1852828 RepID=A0A1V5MBG8_UNCT6|nr:MAG: S-adenosylmethionine:tRNA ribosyltransferase-isomerase [candidate division TA06 bacterium ADurb.Bin417]
MTAVGTTVVRTLEGRGGEGRLEAAAGWVNAFIYPGYRFRIVDAMVTNFHLPRTTTLLLTAAFAGPDRLLAAYRFALERGFRFGSYGDAMLIT